MPAPPGLDPGLAQFLEQIEDRLGLVETPKGPVPSFTTTSTALTAASAAANAGRTVIATDLKTLVWSSGVHWYRSDTGAQIV